MKSQNDLQQLREKINIIIDFQSNLTETEPKEFIKTPTIEERLKKMNCDQFEAKSSPSPSPIELYNKEGEAIGITAYDQNLKKTIFYSYQEEINYNSEINLPSTFEDSMKEENREKVEEQERRKEIEKLQEIEQQRLKEEEIKDNSKRCSMKAKQPDNKEMEL